MTTEPIFHEGELFVQRRAHEEEQAAGNSPMIGSRIMSGAIPFIRQQSMLVAGSIDPSGRLWASLLFGKPGFLDPAPDAQTLRVHLDQSIRQPDDPLWENWKNDPRAGLMVIDLGTRRRLRINGTVTLQANTLNVHVDESFPNCPKYIQRRSVGLLRGSSNAPDPSTQFRRDGYTLGDEQTALIRRADTFFVASAHPTRSADVAHRGGNPGFAAVLNPSTLRIPDYVGNSLFNTLGNLAVNPNAGLVFPDFENHRILQLTGTANLLWDHDDPKDLTGGTHRFWDFHVEYWLEAKLTSKIAASFIDYSRFNP
jgi:predicted pyridoxine 5'-phosphate oxidase superfamily flavin-nucleotide-binding protein